MNAEENLIPPKPTKELIAIEKTVPDDTLLWRYMNFESFVGILMNHGLWFSRPFKFDDRWEGLFPPSYVRQTRQYTQANNIPFEEFEREFHNRNLRHKYAHFVNCWHMNDHESDAMWKLYALSRGEGIAIQSKVGEVKECVRPHNSGCVIYYDPSHKVLSSTVFGPHDILFKRSSFSWEREYRFWFNDDELLGRIEIGDGICEEELSSGRLFNISDMQRLIKKIVVAPGASDEFIENVRAACGEYGKCWLRKRIERSYSDRMWDSFTM